MRSRVCQFCYRSQAGCQRSVGEGNGRSGSEKRSHLVTISRNLLEVTFQNAFYIPIMIIPLFFAGTQKYKQQMSLQIPRDTKFIIRPQRIKQLSNPINIFQRPSQQKLQWDALESIREYLVVGDPQFKRKFCEDRQSERMNTTLGKMTHLEETNMDTRYEERTKTEGGEYHGVVSIVKHLRSQREDQQIRAIKRFAMLRSKEQQLNNFLRTRVPRAEKNLNRTMTYSRKQIQVVPNPQLTMLINQNIPEYWQRTLRNNDKRLKAHVKGNPYKQKEGQMLQTVSGHTRLVLSIPKFKQEYTEANKNNQKVFSRSIYAIGSKIHRYNDNRRLSQNKSFVEAQRLYCEDTYKINYSPASRY